VTQADDAAMSECHCSGYTEYYIDWIIRGYLQM